jgi:hypothetical protein
MKKNKFLLKRIKEMERLKEVLKKNPNYPEEMIENFEKIAMQDITDGEKEYVKDKFLIKTTSECINKTLKILTEIKLISKFQDDAKKVVDYYRNEMILKKRKTCFFQENILCEIERICQLLLEKIIKLSYTCFDVFFKKDAYAGLVLLRSNIENLFLFHYYIDELERYYNQKSWIKIARLNARILYTKKPEVENRFERFNNMDYLEVVGALITMTGAEEKPFHIDTPKKNFLQSLENKTIKIKNIGKSEFLKDLLNHSEIKYLNFHLNYDEVFYDQLSEIVHPVAIEKNRYPFDSEDPSVLNKFSSSYSIIPYSFNLYFYGIAIYEKIRKISFKEINVIEKNLAKEIEKYTIQKNKDYFDKIKNNKDLSEDWKKIINKYYTVN